MARLRTKLTYANVVATLALFVALAGGTAFAASQVLPKNSVGTRQLRNGAVTGAKIKKGTITGSKIELSSLGTVPSAALAASADNSSQLGGTPADGYLKTGQAAGGALSGTFPNPTLASHAVVATGGSTASTALATVCTHYEGAEVTIDAPSPGTVMVSANAWMELEHHSSANDEVYVSVNESPSQCEASTMNTGDYSIPPSLPAFSSQYVTIPVMRTFQVSAGPHTFYLNGQKQSNAEQFFYNAGMTAIFIPS